MKGAPLALFAVLLGGWIGGRAILWDNPYASLALPAAMPAGPAGPAKAAAAMPRPVPPAVRGPVAGVGAPVLDQFALPAGGPSGARAQVGASAAPRLIPEPLPTNLLPPGPLAAAPPRGGFSPPAAPPPANPASAPASVRADRWSVDAWGFARQGSNAAPISQGRVPIYGASQIGAIAQFRAAPHAPSDPRLYARAYRALVRRGETEISLGGSLRPVRALPVRAFAELRYTQTPFADDVRPAVFVVSELPPQNLPGAVQFEAYGQAGWVGGNFATPFADGQASAVREIARFNIAGQAPLRLSAGAGAWGGAQKDASRLDAGPTLRLEWAIGRVPARLSIDWRQQVGGDAAPESGLAATLSTSF